jgi:hypothetical protein
MSTPQELSGTIKSAQTKVQTLISSGSDESRMDELLLLNDMFNAVLSRTTDFREGRDFSRSPIVGTEATFDTSHKQQVSPHLPTDDSLHAPPTVGAISLIDFDDGPMPPAFGTSGPSTSAGQDVFGGMSFLSAPVSSPSAANMFLDPFAPLAAGPSTSAIPISALDSQTSTAIHPLFGVSSSLAVAASTPKPAVASSLVPPPGPKAVDPFSSLVASQLASAAPATRNNKVSPALYSGTAVAPSMTATPPAPSLLGRVEHDAGSCAPSLLVTWTNADSSHR